MQLLVVSSVLCNRGGSAERHIDFSVGAIVIGKLLESKDYAFGYDAQTGEYADLVKKGMPGGGMGGMDF